MRYFCFKRKDKASMQKIRNLMLPIAIIMGILFPHFFEKIGFIVPYLIACSLFITYSNLHIEDLHIKKIHRQLLAFQLALGIGSYYILLPFNHIIAEGVMISSLGPIATAAVVVSGMLGADIGIMTTYTLLCNIVIAVVCPVFFSFIGCHESTSILQAMGIVSLKVFPIIILPLLLAPACKKCFPDLTRLLQRHQYTSFYLWAISLTVAVGKSISYIYAQNNSVHGLIILMAIAALILCIIQFGAGRYIGKKNGDVVAGGQAVGQKNTILCIWMAQTFLEPLSSIVPAMYILWQNLFNSYQIWQKNKKDAATQQKK